MTNVINKTKFPAFTLDAEFLRLLADHLENDKERFVIFCKDNLDDVGNYNLIKEIINLKIKNVNFKECLLSALDKALETKQYTSEDAPPAIQ